MTGANHATVSFDGETLSSLQVELVSKGFAKVEISQSAQIKINKARKVVDNILESDKVVYGINTGFGALVKEKISKEDLETLQLNLIRSHATAVGELMEKEQVRAMMCVRANSLAKGNSGVSLAAVQQIVDLLNLDIIPAIPRIGSLGASGDLAPLSHLALTLIGEGYVMSDGGRVPSKEVLQVNGLIPIRLGAKDGLSLINGTSQMLAMLCEADWRLRGMLKMADIIFGASLDARECTLTPFDERIHDARPHVGQIEISKRVRKIMANSDILVSHLGCDRVQDAYSFRCTPQVHGAVYEQFLTLQNKVSIELNSVTDNPLIFPSLSKSGEYDVISQGNFHGEILALTADNMALALFEIASISERRMDQILDPARSGLPAFLAENSGLDSGLMIVQYVGGASLAEMRGHANPRTAFSTTTSAGQEDHVSMGATACYNLLKTIERFSEVLACEALIAAQALGLNKNKSSPYVESLIRLITNNCQPLTGDRSTSDDLIFIAKSIHDCSWISKIEAECGML